MREPVDRDRIERFFRRLGTKAREDVRVYLAGGATAVLFGWRSSTIDIDLKIVPDSDPLLQALPGLKEELQINVELTAPDQFIPELPGWEERSPFIVREGAISFYHYDLYGQALAKIERGHPQDAQDAAEMVRRGLVTPAELLRLFHEIEPTLYRFPAIDPRSFRRAVEEFLREYHGERLS